MPKHNYSPAASNGPRLAVSKALRQLEFADRSYNLGIWRRAELRELWEHDMEVMLRHNDLNCISLQLLDRDLSILFVYRIAFNVLAVNHAEKSTARGIELPLIEKHRVTSHRVIVSHNNRLRNYQHLLKGNWAPAEKLAIRVTDCFRSEHASEITGGRQSGEFQVDSAARRRLLITHHGQHGYAFARDPNLGIDGVYLHEKYAAPGLQFRTGQYITAIVVQTPRGLQARVIRPG